MKIPVKNIADALQMMSDEDISFLNVDTGEVATVQVKVIGAAEDGLEEPDDVAWDGEWELAQEIASSDRYRKLPKKFDVHEWSIMEQFCNSVESPRLRSELLDAIHGSGAFRHFKNTVRHRGIEQDWYRFRDNALREIAIEWCESEELEWE